MAVMTENFDSVTDTRRAVLEQRVMLLSPRVGQWEGRYKIPTELIDLRIAGQHIDANTAKRNGITTPYTVMITDSWPLDPAGTAWKKRFATYHAAKERTLRRYSIPFSTAGARIVPMTNARQFFHELIGLTIGGLRSNINHAMSQGNSREASSLRSYLEEVLARDPLARDSTPIYDHSRDTQSFAYQWYTAANEFSSQIDDIYRQIRNNIEPREAWDAVKNRIPQTAEQMRAKFYCDVLPVELAGSSGQTERITADTLAAYDSVVREACSRAVESAIETIIERPREELAEAIAGLQDLIDRNGRVSTRSFRPIQEAIEKLRSFRFAANSDIIQAMDDLEARLGVTIPSSLDRTTAANSGFSAALTAVRRELEDATRASQDMEHFGRQLRGMDI